MAQLPSVLYYVLNKMDVGPIIGIRRFKSLSKHLEVVIASCHIERGLYLAFCFHFCLTHLSDNLEICCSFVGHI